MKQRRGHDRAPVAAHLALVVAWFVAACGSTTPTLPVNATTGPSTGPITDGPSTPDATPATSAPIASGTAVAPPCAATDLKASHGLIEGAAGSRLFDLVLVAGTTCSVDAFPTLGVRDASSAAILGGVAGGTGRVDVSPQTSYSSAVRLSNWCVTDAAFPISLEIRLGSEELAVTGPSIEETDVPPCNGGGGATLEAGAWTPGP